MKWEQDIKGKSREFIIECLKNACERVLTLEQQNKELREYTQHDWDYDYNPKYSIRLNSECTCGLSELLNK